MKNYLIILILMGTNCFAADRVLIQSEDVSKAEYLAFLKSEPEYKSAVETQAESVTSLAREKELLAAFDKAERSFLSDTVETAHQNYKAVVGMALISDWNENDRKLIFHCYLRAAQTAIQEKRSDFLIGSIKFDSKQEPDEQLFPPPMVAEWRRQKAKLPMTTLQLTDAYQRYDAALINGVRLDFKRFAIRVPTGPFRLTLLSNQFEVVSKVATAEEFRTWKPDTLPLVSGNCENPQLARSLPSNAVALFSGGCLVSGNAKQNSNAVATGLKLPARLFENAGNFERGEPKAFYEKPVFWAITGTVVAIIAYSASRQKDEPEPTHKTGF